MVGVIDGVMVVDSPTWGLLALRAVPLEKSGIGVLLHPSCGGSLAEGRATRRTSPAGQPLSEATAEPPH